FTGSTRVGKLVMKAAGENLTPVTLELGGKCPAIIHRDFPLRTAIERIMTGKLYNAGQTCLAPDYVFVHESQRDKFVELAREVTQRLYPTLNENTDYTRIINPQHFDRLNGLVRDAVAHRAKAVSLGAEEKPETAPPFSNTSSAEQRLFLPVVLLDVNDE